MKRRHDVFVWTDEACAQLTGLWAEGHSAAEIGRRMGLSKNSIVGRAHRLKLPARQSPILNSVSWTAERRETLRRHVESGRSDGEIAGILGLSISAVRSQRKVRGYTRPGLVNTPPARAPRPAAPQAKAAVVNKPAVVQASVVMRPVAPQPIYAGRISECTYVVRQDRMSPYCDKPTLPGKSMCGEHHRECFLAFDPRRKGNPQGQPNHIRFPQQKRREAWVHPGTFEDVSPDAA